MTNLDSILKSRHYFANKGPSSQSYGFFSTHVWMWELDYKESWVPKNWCFELWCWRRLLRVLWTARRSNQPNWFLSFSSFPTKGNQSWIFIGKTDAKAEAPILWSPDEKNWLIGKDPDAGKDWRREEKGTTEDEMVGWTFLKCDRSPRLTAAVILVVPNLKPYTLHSFLSFFQMSNSSPNPVTSKFQNLWLRDLSPAPPLSSWSKVNNPF